MTSSPSISKLSQNLWFHKASQLSSTFPQQPDLFQTQQLFDLQYPEILCTFDHILNTPDTNPESTQISKLNILAIPPTSGDYSTYLLKNVDSQHKSQHFHQSPISNNNTTHHIGGVLVPSTAKSLGSSRTPQSVKINFITSSNGCRLESWFKQRLFYFPTNPNYLHSIEHCPKQIVEFTSTVAICSNNTLLLHYVEHFDPSTDDVTTLTYAKSTALNTKPKQVMRCIRWFDHPDKRIVSCTAYSPTSVNNINTNSNIIADAAYEKIRSYQTILIKLHEHQLHLNSTAHQSSTSAISAATTTPQGNLSLQHTLSTSLNQSQPLSPQQTAADQTFGTYSTTPPHIEALLQRINDPANNLSDHSVVTIPAAAQSSFNSLYNDAMLSSTDISASNSTSLQAGSPTASMAMSNSPNTSNPTRFPQLTSSAKASNNGISQSSARYQSEISTRLTPLVSHSTTTINNHHIGLSSTQASLQHLHSGYYYAVGCIDGSVYILPIAWMLGSSTSLSALNDNLKSSSSTLNTAISADSSSYDTLPLDRAPSLTKISSISQEHNQSKQFQINNTLLSYTDDNHLLLLPYQAHHPLLPIVVTSTYDKALPSSTVSNNKSNTPTSSSSSLSIPIPHQQLTTTSSSFPSQFTPDTPSSHIQSPTSEKGSSKHSQYTTLSSILASTSSITWKNLDTLHCWYLLDDILSPLLSHPMTPFQMIIGTCDDHLITTLGSYSPLLDSFWWVPPNPHVSPSLRDTNSSFHLPSPSSSSGDKQPLKMTRSEYLYYRFSTFIYQQHRQHHIFVTLRDPTSTSLLQPPQPSNLFSSPLSGMNQLQLHSPPQQLTAVATPSSTPMQKQQILLQKPNLRDHLREQLVLLSQHNDSFTAKSSVHNVISDSPHYFINEIHHNSNSCVISTLFWTTRYGEIFIITLFANNILLFVNVINLKSFTVDLSPYVNDTPIKSIQLVYYDSNNNHNTNLPNNGTAVHTGACQACLDKITKNSSTSLSSLSPLNPLSNQNSTSSSRPGSLNINSVNNSNTSQDTNLQSKHQFVPALSSAHSNTVSSSRSSNGVVLEMSDPLQHELIQAIKDNEEFELAQNSLSESPPNTKQFNNHDDIYNESDNITTVHRTRTFSTTNLPPSLTCLTCLLLLAQREISTQLLVTTIDRQTYTVTIESKLQLNKQQLDLFADIDPMLLRRGIRLLDCYSRDFGLFSTSAIPSLGGKKHTIRHDIYLTSLKAKICGYVSPQVTTILDDRCLMLWSLGKQSINICYKTQDPSQLRRQQASSSSSLSNQSLRNGKDDIHHLPLQAQSQLYSLNLMDTSNELDSLMSSGSSHSTKSSSNEEQLLFDITPTQTRYLATQQYDSQTNALQITSKNEDKLFLQKYYLSLPFDYPLFSQEYDNLLRNTLQTGPPSGKDQSQSASTSSSSSSSSSAASNPSSRSKVSYKADDNNINTSKNDSSTAVTTSSSVSNASLGSGKKTLTLQQLFLLLQSCYSIQFESILSTPFVTRVVQPLSTSSSLSSSASASSSSSSSAPPTPSGSSSLSNVTTSRLHTISLLSASLKHTPIICLSSSYYNNLILPYSQQLYYQQQHDLALVNNPSLPGSISSSNFPSLQLPLSLDDSSNSSSKSSNQLLTYFDIVIFSLLIGNTTQQSRTQLETAKLLDSLLQQLYPVITAQGKSQHAIPTWFEMPVLPILSPLLPKPIILQQLNAQGLITSDSSQSSASPSSSSSSTSQSLKNPVPQPISTSSSGGRPTTQHITNVQQLWPIYAIKWLDYNPNSFNTTTPTGTRITLISSSILHTQLTSFFFTILTEYYQQIYQSNGLQSTNQAAANTSNSSPAGSIGSSIFQFASSTTTLQPEKSLYLPDGLPISRLLTLGKYPFANQLDEKVSQYDHPTIPSTQFLLFLLIHKFVVNIKPRHVQNFFKGHLELFPNQPFYQSSLAQYSLDQHPSTNTSLDTPTTTPSLTNHPSQHSTVSSTNTLNSISYSPQTNGKILTNHLSINNNPSTPLPQQLSFSNLPHSSSNFTTQSPQGPSNTNQLLHKLPKQSSTESLHGARFTAHPPSIGHISVSTSTNNTNNNFIYILPAADLLLDQVQPKGWNTEFLQQQLALYQNTSLCFFYSPAQQNIFYPISMSSYHSLYGSQYLFDNSYIFVLDSVHNSVFIHSTNHLYSRLFPYPEEQQDNLDYFFPTSTSTSSKQDQNTNDYDDNIDDEMKLAKHSLATNKFSPIVQQIQFPTGIGSHISNIISVHSTRHPSPSSSLHDYSNPNLPWASKPSVVIQTTSGVYTLIPSSLQYRYQYLQQLLYKQHDSLLLSYLNSCSHALLSPVFKSVTLVHSLSQRFSNDILLEYKFIVFKDVVNFYNKLQTLIKCAVTLSNPTDDYLAEAQFSTASQIIKPERPESIHQPISTLFHLLTSFLDLEIMKQLTNGTHLAPFPTFPSSTSTQSQPIKNATTTTIPLPTTGPASGTCDATSQFNPFVLKKYQPSHHLNKNDPTLTTIGSDIIAHPHYLNFDQCILYTIYIFYNQLHDDIALIISNLTSKRQYFDGNQPDKLNYTTLYEILTEINSVPTIISMFSRIFVLIRRSSLRYNPLLVSSAILGLIKPLYAALSAIPIIPCCPDLTVSPSDLIKSTIESLLLGGLEIITALVQESLGARPSIQFPPIQQSPPPQHLPSDHLLSKLGFFPLETHMKGASNLHIGASATNFGVADLSLTTTSWDRIRFTSINMITYVQSLSTLQTAVNMNDIEVHKQISALTSPSLSMDIRHNSHYEYVKLISDLVCVSQQFFSTNVLLNAKPHRSKMIIDETVSKSTSLSTTYLQKAPSLVPSSITSSTTTSTNAKRLGLNNGSISAHISSQQYLIQQHSVIIPQQFTLSYSLQSLNNFFYLFSVNQHHSSQQEQSQTQPQPSSHKPVQTDSLNDESQLTASDPSYIFPFSDFVRFIFGLLFTSLDRLSLSILTQHHEMGLFIQTPLSYQKLLTTLNEYDTIIEFFNDLCLEENTLNENSLTHFDFLSFLHDKSYILHFLQIAAPVTSNQVNATTPKTIYTTIIQLLQLQISLIYQSKDVHNLTQPSSSPLSALASSSSSPSCNGLFLSHSRALICSRGTELAQYSLYLHSQIHKQFIRILIYEQNHPVSLAFSSKGDCYPHQSMKMMRNNDSNTPTAINPLYHSFDAIQSYLVSFINNMTALSVLEYLLYFPYFIPTKAKRPTFNTLIKLATSSHHTQALLEFQHDIELNLTPLLHDLVELCTTTSSHLASLHPTTTPPASIDSKILDDFSSATRDQTDTMLLALQVPVDFDFLSSTPTGSSLNSISSTIQGSTPRTPTNLTHSNLSDALKPTQSTNQFSPNILQHQQQQQQQQKQLQHHQHQHPVTQSIVTSLPQVDDSTLLLQSIDQTRHYISSYFCNEYTQINFSNITTSLIFHFLEYSSHIVGFRDEAVSIHSFIQQLLKKQSTSHTSHAIIPLLDSHQQFHRFVHLEPMMLSIANQIGPFIFLYYNTLNESTSSQNNSPLSQFNFTNTISRNTLFDILLLAIKLLLVFDIDRQEYSTQLDLAKAGKSHRVENTNDDDDGDGDGSLSGHFTETQFFLASTWLHALSFNSPSFFDLNYQFNNLTINFGDTDYQVNDKPSTDQKNLKMLREENKLLISMDEIISSQGGSSSLLSQQEQYQQQLLLNENKSELNHFLSSCAFDSSTSALPVSTQYYTTSSIPQYHSTALSSSSSPSTSTSTQPQQSPYLASLLDIYSALTSTIPPASLQNQHQQQQLSPIHPFYLVGYGNQHNMTQLDSIFCKTMTSTHYDLNLIRLGYKRAIKYDPIDSYLNQNETYRIGTTTKDHTSPKETIQLLSTYQRLYETTSASYTAQQLRLRYQQLTLEQQLKQQQQQTYPYSIRLTTTLLFFVSYIQQLIPSLSDDNLSSVILLLQPPFLPNNITSPSSTTIKNDSSLYDESNDTLSHFLSTKQNEAHELTGGLKGMNENFTNYVPLSLDDDEVTELLFYSKSKAINTLFKSQSSSPIGHPLQYGLDSPVSLQSSACTCTHRSVSTNNSHNDQFGLHSCVAAALSDCFNGKDLPLSLSLSFSAASSFLPCTIFDSTLSSFAKRSSGGYSLYNYLLLSTLASHNQINLVEIYFSAVISYVFKQSLKQGQIAEEFAAHPKKPNQPQFSHSFDKLFGTELKTILPSFLLSYYGCYDSTKVQNQLLSLLASLSAIHIDPRTMHADVVIKTKILLLQAILLLDLLCLRLDTIFDRLCTLECLKLGLSELTTPLHLYSNIGAAPIDAPLLQTLTSILQDANDCTDELEQQSRLVDMQFEIANFIEMKQVSSNDKSNKPVELDTGTMASYHTTLSQIFKHFQAITYLITVFYPTSTQTPSSTTSAQSEHNFTSFDTSNLAPQNPTTSLYIIHQLLQNPRMSPQKVVGLLYSTAQYYNNTRSYSALSTNAFTSNGSSLLVHTLSSSDSTSQSSSDLKNKSRQQSTSQHQSPLPQQQQSTQIDLGLLGFNDQLILTMMNKVLKLAQLFDYIASPLYSIYSTLTATIDALPNSFRSTYPIAAQHLQYFITNNTLTLEHERLHASQCISIQNDLHYQHTLMFKEFFSSLLHWCPRFYSLLSPQVLQSTYNQTNNDDKTLFSLSSTVISVVVFNTLANVLIRSYFGHLTNFFVKMDKDRVYSQSHDLNHTIQLPSSTIHTQYQTALHEATANNSIATDLISLIQLSHYNTITLSDLTNTHYITQFMNGTLSIDKNDSFSLSSFSSLDCQNLLIQWLFPQFHILGYAIILSTMSHPIFFQRGSSQHNLAMLFEIPYDTILHFLKRYQTQQNSSLDSLSFALPPTFFNYSISSLSSAFNPVLGNHSKLLSQNDSLTLQNRFYAQCIQPNTFASHLYRSMRKLTTISPLSFLDTDNTSHIFHDLNDNFNHTYPLFSSTHRTGIQCLDSLKFLTQQTLSRYQSPSSSTHPPTSTSLYSYLFESIQPEVALSTYMASSFQRFLSLYNLNSPHATSSLLAQVANQTSISDPIICEQINIMSSLWFREQSSPIQQMVFVPSCHHPLLISSYQQQLFGVGIIFQTLAIILIHERLNLPIPIHIFQLNSQFNSLLSCLIPESPESLQYDLLRSQFMSSTDTDSSSSNEHLIHPTQLETGQNSIQSNPISSKQVDVPIKLSLINGILTSVSQFTSINSTQDTKHTESIESRSSYSLKSINLHHMHQIIQFMKPFQHSLIPQYTTAQGLQPYSYYNATQSSTQSHIFPKQVTMPQSPLIDSIYAVLNELIDLEQRANTTHTNSPLISLEDEAQQHRFKHNLINLVCDKIQLLILSLQSSSNLLATNDSLLECPHCITLQSYPLLYSIFDLLLKDRKQFYQHQ